MLTGVSPYMLVYGRLPRGPLRSRFKKAADRAELHVQHGQEVYTHNYNLLSRDKRFDDNDASPRQRRHRQAV